MKTVTWIHSEQMIPGYGLGETGKDITLPVDIANNFIKQGKAKEIVKAKLTASKGES